MSYQAAPAICSTGFSSFASAPVVGAESFKQLVNEMPHIDAVGKRFGVRALDVKPGFEHRRLDIEQRLQLRPQPVFHRRDNRMPNARGQ